MSPNDLLGKVVDQYLSSDFNGLGTSVLESREDYDALAQLVEQGLVDIISDEDSANPHIKHFPARPIERQVRRISRRGLRHACLYPTTKALVEGDLVAADPASPYTTALRQAAPQLEFRVFRMEVLERYRNEPRYRYSVDDAHGTIYWTGDDKADHEYAQFGFAYDKDTNRYVAAFLRYLHDMSPEQQSYWSAHELQGDFELHPDYFRSSVMGEWPEKVSVFDGLLEEKKVINEMCGAMGKPPLFRSDYEAYRRPSGFGFLIRPTLKEFSEACIQLDQLMSDDLNKKFFEGDIETEENATTESGREFKVSKGTISLLQEWVETQFKSDDKECLPDLMNGFRSARKARQKPAHKIEDNTFDQSFYQQQRDLMRQAYTSVRTLRQILVCHPACKNVRVPEWLFEGKIWFR